MKKIFVTTILPIIVFAIIVMYLYDWPLYKVIDYWIPVDIKKAIEGNNITLMNANITDDFFKNYLFSHLKEFRCPLVKDFVVRIYYMIFRSPHPVILVHQAFYSHTYHDSKGINYLSIPIITLKNIGKETAVLKEINIDIDSENKHNYEEPTFAKSLPIELFPNEEILLFYGQEIPPARFKSKIDIKYMDLNGNPFSLSKPHKKDFIYDFNKKIYQSLF